MNKRINLLFLSLLLLFLAGCGSNEKANESNDLITVGFSQLGSESDWRAANTKSIIDAFSEENGYALLYENAKQKQDNQLRAIRNFVLQNVDFILLAPDAETGWDNALLEAKNANIPVIIVDREVAVEDDSLYLCAIGSDFLKEGRTAVNWLESHLKSVDRDTEEINILHLRGTAGATAEINRSKALEQGVLTHSNWNVCGDFYGEFTEAKGYEVVRDFLETNPKIDVLYSQNDNMTFGAMKAFDEAGITYGEKGDVIIISFDAVRKGLELCQQGKINLAVECSPLHGPQVEELIQMYKEGKEIPKKIYIEETSFTPKDLTEEFVAERPY